MAEFAFEFLPDPVENQLGVLDFKIVVGDGGSCGAWCHLAGTTLPARDGPERVAGNRDRARLLFMKIHPALPVAANQIYQMEWIHFPSPSFLIRTTSEDDDNCGHFRRSCAANSTAWRGRIRRILRSPSDWKMICKC